MEKTLGMSVTLTLDTLGLKEAEVLKKLEAKRANRDYISANKKALRAKYPDMYVAVYDGEVVAAATSLDRVVRKLKGMVGEDISTAEIELITSREIAWIL
jgi:hypothetical protein